MRLPAAVPVRLHAHPFAVGEGLSYGISRKVLAGPRFRTLHAGVVINAEVTVTFAVLVFAALLVVPPDAALSHHSALRWWGVEVGTDTPVHFATNDGTRVRRPGVVLHRRIGRLSPRFRDGVNVLGPDRSFVDAATTLSFVQLVQAGDWLLHLQRTSLDTLGRYVTRSHLDGVLRARRAFAYVRERVESPMETLVRLMIVFARLPEPDTNRDILDAAGRFVARGDLAYVAYRVLVEYDGEWHERSRAQRKRDRDRRAALEQLGWIVVIVLVEDLKDKREIVHRVHRALVSRGYDGRPPHFSIMWTRWFS